MSVFVKRTIFFVLVIAFVIYSLAIYTFGTSLDKGATFLTEKGKRGKLLFQECNCTACHQLYGLGGYMGPDLTNVISSPGKGELYAKAFIENGTSRMPNFHLTPEEVDNLVDYLNYIDKTGISPISKFKLNYDGTITVEENK